MVYIVRSRIEKTGMKFFSALPLTEDERAKDAEFRSRKLELALIRRRACPSGQDYYRAETEGEKALRLRILGELNADD